MKLAEAVQRFLVEEARDTKRSIRRMAAVATIARPRIQESARLWWVRKGIPARGEVISAKLRRLGQLVRR